MALLTEELLAATRLLNDLHEAGLQLLNGWDVLCEDTHLSRFGRNVDLHAIRNTLAPACSSNLLDDCIVSSVTFCRVDAHILTLVDCLMRQRQTQLDLVGRYVGVRPLLK